MLNRRAVMKITRSTLVFCVTLERKNWPSSGKLPSSGTDVFVESVSSLAQPAGDDGLPIVHAHARLCRARCFRRQAGYRIGSAQGADFFIQIKDDLARRRR